MEHFSLPIRNGEEERDDQRRDELEVVRIQAELQHDLEHKVIDHSADGHGQKLEAEIREQLAENDLADDNGSKADDNRAAGPC